MNNKVFETARTVVPNIASPLLSGMLVGSLVGAVVALLYAPSSGEESRAKMRGTAIELRDRATETVKDTVSQAKPKVQELKENAPDKAAGMKQRAKTIADEKLG